MKPRSMRPGSTEPGGVLCLITCSVLVLKLESICLRFFPKSLFPYSLARSSRGIVAKSYHACFLENAAIIWFPVFQPSSFQGVFHDYEHRSLRLPSLR